MENQPRVYSFIHRECGHSEEHSKTVAPIPAPYEPCNEHLVLIRCEEYCNYCMATLSPQELIEKKHCTAQAPRSDEIRRRTQGIWRRLAENPGLVFPSDVDPFRDFLQHDVNYLLVLTQDLQEDLFRRWATPEEPQPTAAQVALYTQVRYAVRQGLMKHLDKHAIPADQVASGGWNIDLTERRSLLEPVERADLERDESDGVQSQCLICAEEFFANHDHWLPVQGAVMPVRTTCCRRILCRDCALRGVEGELKEVVSVATNDTPWMIRPCHLCRADLSPSKAFLAPVNEEEVEEDPSPPWMEIFRPTE